MEPLVPKQGEHVGRRSPYKHARVSERQLERAPTTVSQLQLSLCLAFQSSVPLRKSLDLWDSPSL